MNKYPWKNGDVLVLDNHWVFIYCGYSHADILNDDIIVYHCLTTLEDINSRNIIYPFFNSHRSVGIGSVRVDAMRRAVNCEIYRFYKMMEHYNVHWDAETKCMKRSDGSLLEDRIPFGWNVTVEE